ncbi:MAG: efflux transporter outer membrane subunit [Acetobacteraceae bacterium]|nr:efflux transporter outer membrane subunit [Acetobacteraceae bacterium]MSP29414.1 efflux transporter outer membrane subunit [Acetobacteraceae bacterium]
MSPHPRSVRALLGLLTLAGCDLGPVFTRPQTDIPAAFRASPTDAPTAWPAPDWWRGFASPELDALIDQARAHNRDLDAAAARVRQADAQTRIAGAALLPNIGLTGATGWQKTNLTITGQPRTREVRHHNAGLDISYEVDFWGKNRATAEAAQASALASRFDQQTVTITVTAAVAQTWFAALALQDRLDVARLNLADAEQTLRVIRGRLEAGTTDALALAQQDALVATQRAQIPNLRNQVEQQLIALGILTGQSPAAITLRPGTLTGLSRPLVTPDLPSALLTRRPDVASAEAQLVAANANIRAARAAFFPSIQLTGASGLQSAALSGLLGPGAVIASLSAGLTQPIFDGGTVRGWLELSQARQDELIALYRKAVLQALTDVDSALTALRLSAEQETLQRQAVARSQRAADIARAQLAAGTADITAVLQAQIALYSAQDNLAQVRQAYFQALINLYKALGGGWSSADIADPVTQ